MTDTTSSTDSIEPSSNKSCYDLIIIGGGPAALTAAIYSSRYRVDMLVMAKEVGGMAAKAHKICNFPTYESITGFDFMQKMQKQVEDMSVPIQYDSVTEITKDAKINDIKNDYLFNIKTDSGKNYSAKKIIFAVGNEHHKLDIPGENEYLGKGVSYCATCDAAFFRNKIVSVIGGSDAALTAALLLCEYATKVYIIYRKEKFVRAEPAWIELVEKEKKIETLFNEEVVGINGKTLVESVTLKSGKTLNTNGVFIEIGASPNLSMIEKLTVDKDNNYIVTDYKQETSVEGFYAAGDVTNTDLKQIVTAAAQGAIAAYNVYTELKKLKE